MSSDRRALLRRRPLCRALSLLLLALTALACGKRGDPMPPPRIVPEQTKELSLRQRGREVILEFPYPKVTTAGLALPGLAAVEVWELRRPAAAEGAQPRVDPREFAAAAKLLLTLSGAELTSATAGDRITARWLLEETLPEPPEARVYSLRTVAAGGEASAFSGQRILVPKTPPPAPSPLAVTATAEGIEVTWGEVEGEVVGFHVYRREAEVPTYGAPVQVAGPESRRFVDTGVRYGQRYIYTVCTLASRQPAIESAFAGEREIDYQDRFPPLPPLRLSVLPSESSVRLLWEKSPAADVAGYLIERQDPGGEWRQITAEPVAALAFDDAGLTSGLTFLYRVSAVDVRGNRGEPSAPVEARVR